MAPFPFTRILLVNDGPLAAPTVLGQALARVSRGITDVIVADAAGYRFSSGWERDEGFRPNRLLTTSSKRRNGPDAA